MPQPLRLPRIVLRCTLTGSLALMLAAQPGRAAEVYRCGPTYQQTPCAGGQALKLDDHRDAAQQQAARDVAAQEQQRAQHLAQERHQREAAPGVERARRGAAASRRSAPAAAASAPVDDGARCPSGQAARPTRKKKDSACPDDRVYRPLSAASATSARMAR